MKAMTGTILVQHSNVKSYIQRYVLSNSCTTGLTAVIKNKGFTKMLSWTALYDVHMVRHGSTSFNVNMRIL
eukprot:8440858-Ditylum_brightwellii.AAC.1